ncbi:hypothetical protein [Moorena sp. SIO1F2]|uniref:hypothetical protein n=1 Tax=Moorena sp. SIO1F2 TaxID=2607819 RepID=UPI0025DD1634|nr:hypothetical protein [Moorena sp. SIO1F2]
MGILRGTGILVELASCQFPPYFRAGKMPTLLILIQRFSNAWIELIQSYLLLGTMS